MSVNDSLAIFLAILTFISTMTGVVSTFVTYAQFRRESAARAAAQQHESGQPNVGSVAPGNATSPPSAARRPLPFSFALKSKFRMSLGFLLLAVILGTVWRGSSSNLTSELASRAGKTTPSSSENTEEGQVGINNSKDFFGGLFYISLNSIDFKGEPARSFATFTVGTSEGKSKRISGEEAGFIMDFHGFDVRVISVNEKDAIFQVKKKTATE